MSAAASRALALAFQIAAMGLAAATIALAILDATDAGTFAIIVALAVFSLAIGTLMQQRPPGGG